MDFNQQSFGSLLFLMENGRSQTAAQTNTILSNQPKPHDHPIHQNPTKSTDSTAPNNVPNASNTNKIKPKIIPIYYAQPIFQQL